jgi:hypothetical protein
MKQQDPDDLKIPHENINSLIKAFEQAWQEFKQQKEHDDAN